MMMSPDNFKSAIANAKIGDKIHYYTGHLAFDRELMPDLDKLAQTVYDHCHRQSRRW